MGITNSIGGAVFGAGADLLGGYLSDERAADNAHKQMDFQARMSNTSYQRAVKDMLKAGLNPMLAYSQGGASTPSGALAHNVDLSKIGTETVKNYTQARQVSSAVQLNEAHSQQAVTQADLNSASKAKIEAETINEVLKNPIMKKTVEKMDAEIKRDLAGASSSSATAARTQQVTNINKPAEAGAAGFIGLLHSAQEAARGLAEQIPTIGDLKYQSNDRRARFLRDNPHLRDKYYDYR